MLLRIDRIKFLCGLYVFNLNPMSIMEKIIRYFSFFGTVPWYSSQQGKIIHKKAFKCYSTVLGISVACISLVALNFRLKQWNEEANTTHMFMEIVAELALIVSFETTVVGSSFLNISTWENFLTQIVLLENRKAFSVKNWTVTFILGNLFFLSVCVGELISFETRSTFFLHFCSTFSLVYAQITTATVILNTALHIRYGYQRVNNLLKSVRFDVNMRNLGKVRSLLLLLEDTVDNFNVVFGWPLLLFLFNAVIHILHGLVLATSNSFEWLGKEYETEDKMVLFNGVYVFESMVS